MLLLFLNLLAMASASEEISILSTIHTFLGTIKTGDKSLALTTVLPDGLSTRVHDGQPIMMNNKELIESLPDQDQGDFEEMLFNAEVRVEKDGEYGMVWAPTVVFKDGKVAMEGTDIFSMWKKNGKWIIASINDLLRSATA